MAAMSLWRRLSRRSRLLPGALVFLVVAALVSVAFMSVSGANLAGSGFEGSDGDLVVGTAGHSDWASISPVIGMDPSNSSSDNAFGQGSKEDAAAETVVSGSIPPNKSDLTRFYEASEYGNGKNYLYLAWERSNVLGSANMDFEINQNATSALTAGFTGPVTLNRTAGDVLVTFDFGGSGTPTLGLLKWITAGAVSQCYSASSLPCWGNRVDLTKSGFAEGAVNANSVTDPVGVPAGGSARTLPAQTFGEAAINLTDAGVFPAATCETFGSAFLKSRSSASFTAEVKDFVTPAPVNISNCGTIAVHKVTQNGDGTFGFTAGGGLGPATFNLSNGGTQTFNNVLPGAYSVSEPTAGLPAGWTLQNLACTGRGAGTAVTTTGPTASITMGASGAVDCTFTNHTTVTPRVATVLSASSVTVGGTVHDTATLSGATATAAGTMTYTVFSDPACSSVSASGGTKNVTKGVVQDSDPVTFNTAGDYYWQAAYGGDGDNAPATGPCTDEHLVVTPAPTSITTAQQVVPNDSATVGGATATAGGSVTFALYGPGDPSCLSKPAFTQQVSAANNGTYATTNTTFTATSPGTWRWKVSYSGDVNNAGSTSACGVENFTIANG
jgi:hypothetical protein